MSSEHLTNQLHGSNHPDTTRDEFGWEVVASSGSRPRHIQANETDFAYLDEGDGAPVVMVHGALSDYRSWTNQIRSFSRDYRVISYSRRYHYPNAPFVGDASNYSRSVHLEDLSKFIDALKLGPVHLVGHSYGGSIAAMLAMKHPEKVASLVLAEPSLFSILETVQERVSLKLHRIALNAVLKLAEHEEKGLATRQFVKVVRGQDKTEFPLELLLVLTQNAQTLAPMLHTYFDPVGVSCDDARNIKTPTLLIAGALSPPLYRTICNKLNLCLPNSQFVDLAGASHGLHMENPVGFNSAVLGFLSPVDQRTNQ